MSNVEDNPILDEITDSKYNQVDNALMIPHFESECNSTSSTEIVERCYNQDDQVDNAFKIPQFDGGYDSESSTEEDINLKSVFLVNC